MKYPTQAYWTYSQAVSAHNCFGLACSLADHDAAILGDGTRTGGKSPRPEPTRHCHGAFLAFRLPKKVIKHGFARLHINKICG